MKVEKGRQFPTKRENEMELMEIRNFVLRKKNGKESGVFTGHQPRQAALKAANRSKGTKERPVEIRLREKGTNKVHIFKGWKETVSAPKNKPSWMPEKINKPGVKKIGTERLQGPRVPHPRVPKGE